MKIPKTLRLSFADRCRTCGDIGFRHLGICVRCFEERHTVAGQINREAAEVVERMRQKCREEGVRC